MLANGLPAAGKVRVGIAGMVIWALTAGIGIYLLAVGIGAQRAAGSDTAAAASQVRPATAGNAADGAPPVMGTQALTALLGSGPAPAAPQPEGSPLLEFTHPALALLGLTFWIFFVMTGDRLFAWIGFGVVVATVAAGLSWELSRRRSARHLAAERRDGGDGDGGDGGDSAQGRGADGPRFPPHLVLVHGAAAACTFALVVIAAVAAGHG